VTTVEPGSIAADDGQRLAATWFVPNGVVRGAVVVAPAMATPSVFYRRFAESLAAAGFLVLTFDYRGMERGADVRRTSADVRTWAGDAAAALEAARARLDSLDSNVPITWVGHSLGGQILGFIDHSLLDRIIVIATGQGYWKHNPLPLRWWVRAFWDVVVPVSTRLAGYYPGRRLRFLGDLPAGVVRQWRRWCLHPGYWEADVPDIRERHAAVTAPVTAFHVTDDQILLEKGVQSLLDQFTSAATELVVLSPADMRATTVGHHGFFHTTHDAEWSRLVVPRLASTASETATA
jgi:predicted alpha/beta hydrolase